MQTAVINGYPRYKITGFKNKNGYILGVDGRKLKYNYRGTGGSYPYITLYITGKEKRKTSIHILMAEHFIPNPDNLPIVNHKNHDKSDWSLKNLEWTDYAGNTRAWLEHKKRTK